MDGAGEQEGQSKKKNGRDSSFVLPRWVYEKKNSDRKNGLETK